YRRRGVVHCTARRRGLPRPARAAAVSGAATGRYDGKRVLLTGAASGIGRAVTLRLAGEGARVFALDIDEAGLAGTAEAAGGAVVVRRCDVTSADECRAAVEAAVAEL